MSDRGKLDNPITTHFEFGGPIGMNYLLVILVLFSVLFSSMKSLTKALLL